MSLEKDSTSKYIRTRVTSNCKNKWIHTNRMEEYYAANINPGAINNFT